MENNTTTQEQPIMNPTPPAPQNPTPAQPLPRHMPKSVAIIAIIILLFLLLAGSAVGIYNLGKKSGTPIPSPVAVNSPSPTLEPSANWKTYKGDGFTFQYPTGANISKENAYSFMTAQNVPVIKLSGNNLNDPFLLEIFIENNQKNLSSQQLIDAYLKSIEKSKDTIASARIAKTLTEYKNGEINGLYALFGSDYNYDLVVMTKNNKIYTFVYTGDQGEKISSTDEAVVNQILSTLKFTNSLDSTQSNEDGISMSASPNKGAAGSSVKIKINGLKDANYYLSFTDSEGGFSEQGSMLLINNYNLNKKEYNGSMTIPTEVLYYPSGAINGVPRKTLKGLGKIELVDLDKPNKKTEDSQSKILSIPFTVN